MDTTTVHSGRENGRMPLRLDFKQIFITNLQLLGFDFAAMEVKYKIPFNRGMFSLPNKAGAEAVLHFLFNRLNHSLCEQEFRDCWPVTDKKSESSFRKICCSWLQNIQKEEPDARLPRINASLFLTPGGDKFCHLLYAFSTYVLLHVIRTENGIKNNTLLGYPILTPQTKDLGTIMETTCNCIAIRHRKRYFETLGQTVTTKRYWQMYADELISSHRSLTKDIRELEREERELVQQAAQNSFARGSPVPASRQSYNFDLSEHTARRTHRVKHVRDMWKGILAFVDKAQRDTEIITSILEKTLEKYSIDATNIHISIPHLILTECEEEIRRRHVNNIYERGKLNLVSLLQLWNLALRKYLQKLNQSGLKDLLDEACKMRRQAHAHQAYLKNTTTLRAKMMTEVPQRKRAIECLRRGFCSDETPSSIQLSAPSPPVIFDLPRGHFGASPKGPMLPYTPDSVETPEAASSIASSVSQSSQRSFTKHFKITALGITDSSKMNRNNSNRNPKSEKDAGHPRRTHSKEASTSSVGNKGRGGRQSRIVRHGNQESTNAPSSTPKNSLPAKSKKSSGYGRQILATSLPKVSNQQSEKLDKILVNAGFSKIAMESSRQRVHNILAEKIVQEVMQPDEEDTAESNHHELEWPGSRPLETRIFDLTSTLNDPFDSPPTSRSMMPIPSQKCATTVQGSQPEKLNASKVSPLSSPSRILPSTQTKNNVRELLKVSVKHRTELPSSEKDQTVHNPLTSPETLVQKAWPSGAKDVDDADKSGSDVLIAENHGEKTETDGDQMEAKSASIQNPDAAISEEVFSTHDLIHRSPLAADIQRMWQDAISDDADACTSSDIQGNLSDDLADDWLDAGKINLHSAHTLTTSTQQFENLDVSGSLLQASVSSSHSSMAHLHTVAGKRESSNDDCPKLSEEQIAEDREGYSESVKINETMQFYTSFDEDPEGGSVECSIYKQNLHQSNEVKVRMENDHEKDNIASFDSALDEQLSDCDVLLIDSVASLGKKKELPLISFSPQNTLHASPELKVGLDVAGDFCLDASAPQTVNEILSGNRSLLTSLDSAESSASSCKFATITDMTPPEDTLFPGTKISYSQSSDSQQNSHSHEKFPLKGITLPPELSPAGHSRHSHTSRHQLLNQDFVCASGDAFLDDSFSPLCAGLSVQGKSPGRISSQHSANICFDQLKAESLSHSNSIEGRDENLAARVNHLRKMTAVALKNCETSMEKLNSLKQKTVEDKA